MCVIICNSLLPTDPTVEIDTSTISWALWRQQLFESKLLFKVTNFAPTREHNEKMNRYMKSNICTDSNICSLWIQLARCQYYSQPYHFLSEVLQQIFWVPRRQLFSSVMRCWRRDQLNTSTRTPSSSKEVYTPKLSRETGDRRTTLEAPNCSNKYSQTAEKTVEN